MAERFDKFTERARKVLNLAQEEAHRFNHNYIGTEHILLGLVREGEGVAARVLGNLGVELHKVRSAVEFIIGRGEKMVLGDIGLTPHAKKVVELAIDEAQRLNHHYIGTEHILLGLVREGEGIAAGVLESMGVSLAKVRSEVMRVLNSNQGNPPIHNTAQVTTVQMVADPPELGSQLRDKLTRLVELRMHKEEAAKNEQYELAANLYNRESEIKAELEAEDFDYEQFIGGLHELGVSVSIYAQTSNTRPEQIAPQFSDVSLNLLAAAVGKAIQAGSVETSSAHLLLALLQQPDSPLATILTNLGVEQAAFAAELAKLLKQR